MSLLPYVIDDLRPRRDFLSVDLFDDIPSIFHQSRRYLGPWRNLAAVARDIGSTIKSDKDKFQVNIDVQHFDPEEICVKTSEGYVVIEGKHEERKDEHGLISRQFKRRYALPEGCNPESVESKLSSDGVLTVIAPKVQGEKDERRVPVTQTGPVRRKIQDQEQDEVDGDAELDEKDKTPQKKRRR